MNEFDKLLQKGRLEQQKAATAERLRLNQETNIEATAKIEATALARGVLESTRRVASVALHGNRKVRPDTHLARRGTRYQYMDLFDTSTWNTGGTKVTYTPLGRAWTLCESAGGGYDDSHGGIALSTNGDIYSTVHNSAYRNKYLPKMTLVQDYALLGHDESAAEIQGLAISTQNWLVDFVLKHELDVQLLGPS